MSSFPLTYKVLGGKVNKSILAQTNGPVRDFTDLSVPYSLSEERNHFHEPCKVKEQT